jgi:hypothetical protein
MAAGRALSGRLQEGWQGPEGRGNVHGPILEQMFLIGRGDPATIPRWGYGGVGARYIVPLGTLCPGVVQRLIFSP